MNPLAFVDRLLAFVPAPVVPAKQPDTAWQRCACHHGRWQHRDGTEQCSRCSCSFFEGILP